MAFLREVVRAIILVPLVTAAVIVSQTLIIPAPISPTEHDVRTARPTIDNGDPPKPYVQPDEYKRGNNDGRMAVATEVFSQMKESKKSFDDMAKDLSLLAEMIRKRDPGTREVIEARFKLVEARLRALEQASK
jgi:hypothetical protein